MKPYQNPDMSIPWLSMSTTTAILC
jgi:hypothetical protein